MYAPAPLQRRLSRSGFVLLGPAEVVGGAIALKLLFGLPLLVGGVLTGLVSFSLLVYQSRHGQRPFEAAIVGLLAVVLLGFVVSTVQSRNRVWRSSAGSRRGWTASTRWFSRPACSGPP